MVAVHTAPCHADGVPLAENVRIAAFFIGDVVIFYRLQYFFHGVAADDHDFYAVAVQTILNALGYRHGHAEGRTLRFQQRAGSQGFHDGDGHAFGFTGGVQLLTCFIYDQTALCYL